MKLKRLLIYAGAVLLSLSLLSYFYFIYRIDNCAPLVAEATEKLKEASSAANMYIQQVNAAVESHPSFAAYEEKVSTKKFLSYRRGPVYIAAGVKAVYFSLPRLWLDNFPKDQNVEVVRLYSYEYLKEEVVVYFRIHDWPIDSPFGPVVSPFGYVSLLDVILQVGEASWVVLSRVSPYDDAPMIVLIAEDAIIIKFGAKKQALKLDSTLHLHNVLSWDDNLTINVATNKCTVKVDDFLENAEACR